MTRPVVATVLLVMVLLLGSRAFWEHHHPRKQDTVSFTPSSVSFTPSSVQSHANDLKGKATVVRATTENSTALAVKTADDLRGESIANQSLAKFDRKKEVSPVSRKINRAIPTSDLLINSTGSSVSELSMFGLSNITSNTASTDKIASRLGGVFSENHAKAIEQVQQFDNDGHSYQQWAPEVFAGELPQELSRWTRTSSHLVSFDRFGELRVYDHDQLPTTGELAAVQVATRAPSSSEKAAVERIKNGTPFVIDLTASPPVFVTAIVAQQSCIKCHNTSPGDVISAFTHVLTKK